MPPLPMPGGAHGYVINTEVHCWYLCCLEVLEVLHCLLLQAVPPDLADPAILAAHLVQDVLETHVDHVRRGLHEIL